MLGSLIVGAVLLAVLTYVELHIDEPMLDLRLLADRSFRTPNIVSFCSMGALIGVLFLLPQFLQGPRGLTPFQSGLTTFPQAFGVILMARVVGTKLYPVIGPRRLATAGTFGTAVITSLFLFVGLETSQWWIRLLMFSRGLMIGLIFIPVQAAAFARIKAKDTGRASALFQAQRQVASAVGVAFLATILVERLNTLLPTATTAHEQAVAGTQAFHAAIIGAVDPVHHRRDRRPLPPRRGRGPDHAAAGRGDRGRGPSHDLSRGGSSARRGKRQRRGAARLGRACEGHAEPWVARYAAAAGANTATHPTSPHNGVRRSEGRSMVMRAIEAHHEVVEQAAELAVARLDGEHGEQLAAFIRQYYARVAPDDIGHRDPPTSTERRSPTGGPAASASRAIPRACGSTTPTSRPTAGRAATRWWSWSATIGPSSSTR